jgi:hypothetical protein
MATMAENGKNINGMADDGEIRPRACSSASVIVRNGENFFRVALFDSFHLLNYY